ncbi:MAG: Uma2 family endonuclease [Acidobacteria bacterium]|nr:Uma2 family endonuclease [Acidobacteriota bacterium]
MSAQPKLKYTLQEYLKMDRGDDARLEYWDGEIFDMAGGSEWHYEIEGNLIATLKPRLNARGCRAFTGNTRLKVPSLPPYRYGDFSALCGKAQFEQVEGAAVLTNPSLIIEVLSKSTEGFERGDKFTHYQSIPSFCEYLLVSQHRPHVTHLVKQADGSWNQREYNDMNAMIKFAALDGELSLQEIYQAVSFPDAEPPHPLIGLNPR